MNEAPSIISGENQSPRSVASSFLIIRKNNNRIPGHYYFRINLAEKPDKITIMLTNIDHFSLIKQQILSFDSHKCPFNYRLFIQR